MAHRPWVSPLWNAKAEQHTDQRSRQRFESSRGCKRLKTP